MLEAKAFPDEHGDHTAWFVLTSTKHPDVKALLDTWRGQGFVECLCEDSGPGKDQSQWALTDTGMQRFQLGIVLCKPSLVLRHRPGLRTKHKLKYMTTWELVWWSACMLQGGA
eukprot:9133827-Alexandrium_andersonii.AAC.1